MCLSVWVCGLCVRVEFGGKIGHGGDGADGAMREERRARKRKQ